MTREELDRLHRQFTLEKNQQEEQAKREAFSYSLRQTIGYHPVAYLGNVWLSGPGMISWYDFWIQDPKPMSAWIFGKKRLSGILEDLQEIESGADEAVLAFVTKWGAICIDARYVEVDTDSGNRARLYTEPIESYVKWANRVRAIVSICADLREGRPGRLDDWRIWLELEHTEKAEALLLREELHLWELIRSTQSIPGATLSFSTPQEHPAYIAKTEELDWAHRDDRSTWACFQSEHERLQDKQALEYANSKLFGLLHSWLSISTNVHFRDNEGFGFAHLYTHVYLSSEMEMRFIDHRLVRSSSLLHVGLSLLQILQSPLPRCGLCGRLVVGSKIKNGKSPYCGRLCREQANREKVCKYMRTRRGTKKPRVKLEQSSAGKTIADDRTTST